MSNKIHCWGKTQTWYPEKIFNPETLDEVREILIKAKEANVPVHVLGSAHSMNDIATTSGYMIRTEKLCRVLNIDKDTMTVRVEGGIKVHDLLDALIKEDLTLPNQGYITEQAIAGAIATATHGSGATGTISSFVKSIELVDANGTLHVLDPETTPELFSAACVHLGCLGIVYAVTLRCIPLFKLHLTKTVEKLSYVLENLDSLRTAYPFMQFILDPYSDNVLVWKYTPTDEPCKNRWIYKLRRGIVKLFAWLTFDIGFHSPSWMFPNGVKLYMKVAQLKSCVDYAPRILSPADEGHYVEMEIAVPYAHFQRALEDVRKIIKRYTESGVNMVSVIVLRFVEEDSQGYMSPAYKRKTAYISLITLPRNGYEYLFKEVQNALYRYKGRPHWGKVHFLTKEAMPIIYDDAYLRFLQAKAKLDPDNRFANGFSTRLFGDS